jgi:hypothetical protein
MKRATGVTRKITLNGLTDIMFDRYSGDNKTQLRPDQKLYLQGKTIVLPALNIMSLLSAQNTPSAPKRFLDSRQYKKVAQAILSYAAIQPFEIPFLRDGESIQFGSFDGDEVDQASGVYIRRDVARLDKGIPNPKVRPVLPLPWQLKFELLFFPNSEVTEEQVQNLLIRAGQAIGLGTFRGVFGKFSVEAWN